MLMELRPIDEALQLVDDRGEVLALVNIVCLEAVVLEVLYQVLRRVAVIPYLQRQDLVFFDKHLEPLEAVVIVHEVVAAFLQETISSALASPAPQSLITWYQESYGSRGLPQDYLAFTAPDGVEYGFEKLPPEIQTVVGCPKQLASWELLDSKQLDTVVQSNFMRSYRAVIEDKERMEMLPEGMRQVLPGANAEPALTE